MFYPFLININGFASGFVLNLFILAQVPQVVIYVIAAILFCWILVEIFIWRVGVLAKRKKEIFGMQLEYAKLEGRALRAQMNPHFIFNSLNSIKLLLQENENEKAIYYLTTFTKLLRGLLNSADASTVRLYDELETCRLYLELESLRFSDGFKYQIDVAENVDLKTIEVPALIIQPFIENAIWHGLMPKTGDRQLCIRITSNDEFVTCLVDDNGIGRTAAQERSSSQPYHKSKGMQLTNDRLKLNDKLNDSETTLVIRDKYSASGQPLGTQVELQFMLNA